MLCTVLWCVPCCDLYRVVLCTVLWCVPCCDVYRVVLCTVLCCVPCCDVYSVVMCTVLWCVPQHSALIFCFAPLHNLVNIANFVQNLFLVYLFLSYLFLVYLSISTCFGRLCALHQEKQLCLCDTWYFLFCVDDYLMCRVEWTLHIKNKLCTNWLYLQALSPYRKFVKWTDMPILNFVQ